MSRTLHLSADHISASPESITIGGRLQDGPKSMVGRAVIVDVPPSMLASMLQYAAIYKGDETDDALRHVLTPRTQFNTDHVVLLAAVRRVLAEIDGMQS